MSFHRVFRVVINRLQWVYFVCYKVAILGHGIFEFTEHVTRFR
jgi:hypothetical protein